MNTGPVADYEASLGKGFNSMRVFLNQQMNAFRASFLPALADKHSERRDSSFSQTFNKINI